jgi:C1A family cysteine protease
LVDCSTSYGNQGCNGGWPASALKYIKDKGLSLESQYPYVAKQGTCRINTGSFKINGIVTVSNSCSSLTSSINVQPIAVTVDATNWSRYSSGVFSNCAKGINHAVLLVGIVSGNWKIKNSWGTGWGEKGYIRLASGNTCGLCVYQSSYPK